MQALINGESKLEFIWFFGEHYIRFLQPDQLSGALDQEVHPYRWYRFVPGRADAAAGYTYIWNDEQLEQAYQDTLKEPA